MRKNIRPVVVLAGLLLLVACQTTSKDFEAAYPQGKIFEGSLVLGTSGIRIPLPEGPWTLLSSDLMRNSEYVGVGLLVLGQFENDTLARIMVAKGTLDYSQYGFQTSRFCRKSDSHHHLSLDAAWEGQEESCWGIRHENMSFMANSKYEYLRETARYLETHGIGLPENMVYVKFRAAGRSSAAESWHYFNPELEGFPPPSDPHWERSPWHPAKIRANDDSARQAYIDKLATWGERWYGEFKKGFAEGPK